MPEAESAVESTETAVSETSAQAAESQPLDRSWQALQRQEARLREQSEKLRAERQRIERFDQIESLRESDPMQAARLAGLDPIVLGGLALGQQREPETPEQIAEKKLGSHDEQIADLKRQLGELATAKKRAELHSHVSALVSAAGDGLGLTSMMLSDQGYLDGLEQRAAESGGSWDDVLRLEEERHEQQLMSAVKNLLTSPKMRARVMAEVGSGPAANQDAKPQSRPRTLSNKMQAEPPIVRDRPGATAAERKIRAIKALEKTRPR